MSERENVSEWHWVWLFMNGNNKFETHRIDLYFLVSYVNTILKWPIIYLKVFLSIRIYSRIYPRLMPNICIRNKENKISNYPRTFANIFVFVRIYIFFFLNIRIRSNTKKIGTKIFEFARELVLNIRIRSNIFFFFF